MSKSTVLALIMALVIVLSGKHIISDDRLEKEDTSILTSSQKNSVDIELKIHEPGGSWDDYEQLIWHPNHIESNRTIQFTVNIDGIPNDDLAKAEISLSTREGKVLTLIELNPEDFFIDTGDLIGVVNYTYRVEYYFGDVIIQLTALENDGTEHVYNHQGIYLSYIQPLLISENDNETIWYLDGDNIYFNFFAQNIGGFRYILDFQLAMISQLPPSWSSKGWNVSFPISLEPGENISMSYSVSIPDGNTDKIDQVEFKMTSSFYNESSNSEENLPTILNNIQLSKYPARKAISVLVNEESIGDAFTINSHETFEFSPQNHSLFLDEEGNLTLTIEITNNGKEAINPSIRIKSRDSHPPTSFSEDGVKFLDEKTFANRFSQTLEPFDSRVFYTRISPNETVQIQNLPVELDVQFGADGTNLVTLPIYIPMYNSAQLTLVSNDSSIIFNNTDYANFTFSAGSMSFFGYQNLVNQWNLSVDFFGDAIEDSVETKIYCLEIEINPKTFPMYEKCSMLINHQLANPVGNYSLNISIKHVNQPDYMSPIFVWSYPVQFIKQDTSNENPNNITNATDDNSTLTDNNTNITNNTDNNKNNISGDAIDLELNNSDNDSDGIIDTLDDCFETPSNSTVGEDGCIIEDPQAEVDKNSQINDVSSSSDEESGFIWLVVILFTVALTIGVMMIIKSRKLQNVGEIAISKPIGQLPPTPAVEQVVVVRQWTDDSGYSWRMMSDNNIMWWNGSDWIPYGKN